MKDLDLATEHRELDLTPSRRDSMTAPKLVQALTTIHADARDGSVRTIHTGDVLRASDPTVQTNGGFFLDAGATTDEVREAQAELVAATAVDWNAPTGNANSGAAPAIGMSGTGGRAFK